MRSAFGVEHGEVSKAFGGSLLGAGSKLNTGAGAGGVAGKQMSGIYRQRRSAVNYKGARAQAKKGGQKAAQQFRQIGNPKTYGGYEGAHPGMRSANEGWMARGAAEAAKGPASTAKPAVGMRGPIKSRVKTTKMRENERGFI